MSKASAHFYTLSSSLVALAFATLACIALNTSARSSQDGNSRIQARVEIVNVGLTVTDAQGHLAENLTRENFRVLDNGAEQPIANFASIKDPAQVLILIESGPGVFLIERGHLQAANLLLRGLASDDRVALAGYDRAPRAILNFTTDKNEAAQAIAGLHYNLGMAELNLFASLNTAVDWLGPIAGKKAIVLLSSGLDTSAGGEWEKLERKLRASEVVILPVELGFELRSPPPTSGKKKKAAAPPIDPNAIAAFMEADRALTAIAAATGGQAFFPQKGSDLPGVFTQVAALLRHQYSLGFRPQHDGQFHKIDVQLTNLPGHSIPTHPSQPVYRVNHRQAYIAPNSL